MRHIRPQRILELNDVGGRRYVLEVKRGDSIDVLEDPRKLAGHGLDLSLTEAEAG
jgi:hypothetical protein